jgi:hypothetical protein
MEAVCVEFEPFIDERAQQFINGIDYYSIAATSLPNYFPINFGRRARRRSWRGARSALGRLAAGDSSVGH